MTGIGKDMIPISSADLVALLDSLDAPVVITKNKKPESSWTFREDPDVEGVLSR